jgi:hypothetical protein
LEDQGPSDWNRSSSSGHGGVYDYQFRDNADEDADGLVKMSTWAGQPKVEGSTETMRMVLLTCVSIGITSVHTQCAGKEHAVADLLPTASPGVLR